MAVVAAVHSRSRWRRPDPRRVSVETCKHALVAARDSRHSPAADGGTRVVRTLAAGVSERTIAARRKYSSHHARYLCEHGADRRRYYAHGPGTSPPDTGSARGSQRNLYAAPIQLCGNRRLIDQLHRATGTRECE